ncbi:MAG: hypothetical protein M1579_03615 [Gammaproteobacteria bacterium]|nr:hypothetical protein [Gammaproteobacteria bacterium]
MDVTFLNLLAEGEGFLLSLAKHDQDTVLEQLSAWQTRIEDYIAQMPDTTSQLSLQKGNALITLVKRLEVAFSQQAEWIKQQQTIQRQQHTVAQKYTQNV